MLGLAAIGNNYNHNNKSNSSGKNDKALTRLVGIHSSSLNICAIGRGGDFLASLL